MLTQETNMTAEEFFGHIKGEKAYPSDFVHMKAIEFAKYHVEQALLAASKTKRIDLYVRPDRKGSKYKLVEPGESYDILGTRQMWKVNKESIINAYPLTKIQ